MAKIIFIPTSGLEVATQASAGTSLLQAAVASRVSGILGECGGSIACGTCHVYIEEERLGDLPAMSDAESEMLEFTASPRQANSRLACQVEISDVLEGLRVRIPHAQI